MQRTKSLLATLLAAPAAAGFAAGFFGLCGVAGSYVLCQEGMKKIMCVPLPLSSMVNLGGVCVAELQWLQVQKELAACAL